MVGEVAAAVPPTEFGFTVKFAKLLILIILLQTEHEPEERFETVTVVAPLFPNTEVVKVPVPAVVTVMLAVKSVAVLVPDKL